MTVTWKNADPDKDLNRSQFSWISSEWFCASLSLCQIKELNFWKWRNWIYIWLTFQLILYLSSQMEISPKVINVWVAQLGTSCFLGALYICLLGLGRISSFQSDFKLTLIFGLVLKPSKFLFTGKLSWMSSCTGIWELIQWADSNTKIK